MPREGTFTLVSDLSPQGDQPQAIEQLVAGVQQELKHQVLLGVTGSVKTFSIAHDIAQVNRPTLVMAPNKTLAPQHYNEFTALFPDPPARPLARHLTYHPTQPRHP